MINDTISIEIPVFIINLERDSDRKRHMKALCEMHGLKPVFINGVYGLEIADEELESIADEEKTLRLMRRPLT